MMDKLAAAFIWKAVDVAFALAEAGFNRREVVIAVREREQAQATPEQLLVFLKDLEADEDKKAQIKIDQAIAARAKAEQEAKKNPPAAFAPANPPNPQPATVTGEVVKPAPIPATVLPMPMAPVGSPPDQTSTTSTKD